jgi:NTP pyrophosphatase (non-canonical NTP hydrolase)
MSQNPEFDVGLDDAFRERLAILVEECGETAQIVGKTLRHGIESHHPKTPDKNNRDRLEEELADIVWIMRRMVKAKDVDMVNIELYVQLKEERAGQYLHFQPEDGYGACGAEPPL